MTDSKRTILALIVMVMSLLLGYLMHAHPENLNAPAWVAYSAAAAFFLAGLAMLSASGKAAFTQKALPILLTLCLAAPGLWVAFGEGDRSGPVSLLVFTFQMSDLFVRSVFGLGSLVVFAYLLFCMRSSFRSEKTQS